MAPPPLAPGVNMRYKWRLIISPKGAQGWIAIGTLDSRLQHYRLEYRNTLKEHEVILAGGLFEPHLGGPGTPATFASEALDC